MKPWTFLHICDMQPGSPRSFRFNPRFMENWQMAHQQLSVMEADVMLVGGDLTRDGSIHDFEFEAIKADLDALPYPYYAIPGNMDTGNKHASVNGATGREDPRLNVTSEQLNRFARFFGRFPWSFVHKNIRFSGMYAAVAGSGLSHEEVMWQWLEEALPTLDKPQYHVMVIHYPLFVNDINEPTWNLSNREEYTAWYFTIDQPHRRRIMKALKAARVELVLSGHIHCRRPVQTVEGIRFFKCAAIAMPQWAERWPDGDPRLGFYRFDVSEDGIVETFIPLRQESQAVGAYGPGGHPKPEKRDYSLAWEQVGTQSPKPQ